MSLRPLSDVEGRVLMALMVNDRVLVEELLKNNYIHPRTYNDIFGSYYNIYRPEYKELFDSYMPIELVQLCATGTPEEVKSHIEKHPEDIAYRNQLPLGIAILRDSPEIFELMVDRVDMDMPLLGNIEKYYLDLIDEQ